MAPESGRLKMESSRIDLLKNRTTSTFAKTVRCSIEAGPGNAKNYSTT